MVGSGELPTGDPVGVEAEEAAGLGRGVSEEAGARVGAAEGAVVGMAEGGVEGVGVAEMVGVVEGASEGVERGVFEGVVAGVIEGVSEGVSAEVSRGGVASVDSAGVGLGVEDWGEAAVGEGVWVVLVVEGKGVGAGDDAAVWLVGVGRGAAAGVVGLAVGAGVDVAGESAVRKAVRTVGGTGRYVGVEALEGADSGPEVEDSGVGAREGEVAGTGDSGFVDGSGAAAGVVLLEAVGLAHPHHH